MKGVRTEARGTEGRTFKEMGGHDRLLSKQGASCVSSRIFPGAVWGERLELRNHGDAAFVQERDRRLVLLASPSPTFPSGHCHILNPRRCALREARPALWPASYHLSEISHAPSSGLQLGCPHILQGPLGLIREHNDLGSVPRGNDLSRAPLQVRRVSGEVVLTLWVEEACAVEKLPALAHLIN